MTDSNAFKKSDFVEVVDADGNAIPTMPVAPKSWLGTALVPPGTKKGKPKSDDDASTSSSSSSTPAKREPGTEPAKNASRDEWAAYAVEKGAQPDDLLDDKGEELDRGALIEKYAAKA